MSLITRCPACGTMFRVVPDQLRISEGWVRCGHCSDVFDASANLQEPGALAPAADVPPPGQPSASPQADAPPAPGGEVPLEAPAAHAASSLAPEAWPSSGRTDPSDLPDAAAGGPATDHDADGPGRAPFFSRADVQEPAPEPEPLSRGGATWDAQSSFSGGEDPTFSGFATTFDGHEDSILAEELAEEEIEAQALALGEQPGDQPFTLRRADLVQPDADAPAPAVEPAAPPVTRIADSDLPPEPELHELSFVRQGERRRFWGRSGMRATLAVAAVFLLALLGLQVAYQERDRLAAYDPSWKPWLSGLCGVAGCTLGAARQIESIAVDGSSFNRQRGDTYRLSLTLRNQAPLEVALPAVELTLTDAQDQPVIRRVLLPSEIAPGTAVIGARSEWSGQLALAVDPAASAGRIAGYRVLAFYP